MYEVIGIGSVLFDTLMLADGFPTEDTKLKSSMTKQQGGGPCATALVAISKLGTSAAYLGTVGDDMYGQLIMKEFEKYQVGTEEIKEKKGCISANSFVLLNTVNATRTCIWNLGTLPPLQENEINLEMLKQAKILHLDGHQLETAIFAAKKAHEFGVKVSLDAGGTYPGIERLLPLVDILIPSEEFALKMTGCDRAEDAIKILQERYSPEILTITQGKSGGILYQEDTVIHYPAYPVNAVDTNGAGDVFHGAFLVGLSRGMEPFSCACFASAVSALKCMKVGAREGVPSYEEAINFLKIQGGSEYEPTGKD